MTNLIAIPRSDDSNPRFPSFTSLRLAHGELLKFYRETNDKDAIVSNICTFIKKGCATGALIDNDDDRLAAQSLLDYWTSVLLRDSYPAPSSDLAEFDITLAPELNESDCPYLGLEAFQEKDANLFYGRQRLVTQLLDILTSNAFLAVVGPSGSGKSSVVRGGLIPKLKAGALPHSDQWHYFSPMVPGGTPLENLVKTLALNSDTDADWVQQQIHRLETGSVSLPALIRQRGGDQPTVVVIDQFEELFTLCSETTRDTFVKYLVALVQATEAPQNYLILTMRSDFEDRATKLHQLWPLFKANLVRVLPLDAGELREAIEIPAQQVGLKFEAGVVDKLITDVLGEPAALPLLQFMLLQLWEHRERNRVTYTTYHQLGGGRGALAHSADEFYTNLIPEDQETAKRILLKMVRPSSGLEVTNNRIRQQELYQLGIDPGRINHVLQKLFIARLVRRTSGETPDDTQIELAHEALIRNWPRLIDWLNEERISLRQRLRLTEAAEQWQTRNQDASLLWRGALLADTTRYEDFSSLERSFLKASQAVEASERCQEIHRLQFQTWAIRGLAGLSLALVSLIGVVIYQLHESKHEQVNLMAVNAQALLPDQPVEATLYSIEAYGLSRSPMVNWPYDKANDALVKSLWLLSTQPFEVNRLSAHKDWVLSIAFSQNGEYIVTASRDRTLRLWDIKKGQSQLLGSDQLPVWSVAFSPDGKYIVSGSADKTLQLWNAQTGKQIGLPMKGHEKPVTSVAFSPDGKYIVSGSEDKTLRLWNAQTEKQIGQPLTGHTGYITSVAFSSDGKYIVSGSADKELRLWNAQTRKQIGLSMKGHQAAVRSVVFSPDGRYIASGSADNTLRMWDAQTGKYIGQPFQGHQAWVLSVAFSSDGKYIVSGSLDRTLRLWNAQTGKQIGQPFQGHQAAVRSVVFSPDGRYIASGSADNTLRMWDARTVQQIDQPLQGNTGIVRSVAFSPHGNYIVSGSEDQTLRLWEAQTGKQIGLPMKGHEKPVTSVAFSSDGKYIVSGSADKELRLWNTQTGKQIGLSMKGHQGPVTSVAFSPHGNYIVSGSEDKTLRLWEAQTRKQIGQPLTGHTGYITSVAFSFDGKYIVSGSADKELRLWNAQTGKQIGQPLTGHTGYITSVAFSSDGKYIVSGSEDMTLRLWNGPMEKQMGKQIGQPLTGHYNWVNSVAFSPDGKYIVSGSADKMLRLWDAQTEQPVGVSLSGHTDYVTSVAFSPDGKYIVSGSADKMLRLWNFRDLMDSKRLVQTLCQHLQEHSEFTKKGNERARNVQLTCKRL
jgi:WD40 repeat protein